MIAFWVISIVMVASAVATVTAKKPVYSVVALLLNFAALAALYITLSAEFLAVMQIIVYSGAILMLFLFVIALLSSGVSSFNVGPDRMPKAAIPAALVIAIALGFVVYGLSNASIATPAAPSGSALGPVGSADVFGSVSDFGKALFTTHLLPFEITALILMVAVVGVVLLAGDKTPFVGTRERAREVRREMREAILREGGVQ